MSVDTWNFPCWQTRDRGVAFTRGNAGGTFACTDALPFGSAISGVFSFLIYPPYTYDSVDWQVLHGIGTRNSTRNAVQLGAYYNTAGFNHCQIKFWDETGGVTRYNVQLGDEDGVSWCQTKKWYQVAFSADSSEFQYAVNGTTAPMLNVVNDTPGALSITQGSERWWFGGGAYFGIDSPLSWTGNWPTLVAGPAAFDGSSLDLSDSAVLGRIFDSEGNLKNPGENASLWWNDTYTTTSGFKPDVFLPDGSARFEGGSAGLTFTSQVGGAAGSSDAPGGLRKFYE